MSVDPLAEWLKAQVTCKHCKESVRKDGYNNLVHATGPQTGMSRCAIDPYGFLAELETTPCSDHPANPCNGSRGLTPNKIFTSA